MTKPGMTQRLLLGPVLIAALIGLLALDQHLDAAPLPSRLAPLSADGSFPPGTLLFVVMAALCVLAARELSAILEDKGIEASKRAMTFAAVAGLATSCLVPEWMNAVDAVAVTAATAVMVLVGSLTFYARNKNTQGVVASTGGSLLAFVYLGLTFGFLLAIRRDHSAWTLLWVLAVTKSCDIGAYFTGVALGRHKLIPWLSPGKTWEGLFGGIALASAVAVLGLFGLTSWHGVESPPIWLGVTAGLVFAVIGQFGDLTASLLKRDAGIKDSGRVIPGFGGVLDVIDSPLLVAPVAFMWLRVAERAGYLHGV